MADLHIEDFYRDVAGIFLQLYRSFPRKVILYVEDVSGPDQPDEFGLHNPRFDACFSTMIWLAEHDYLRFDDVIGREALDQAVLTQRSFLLLTSRSELHLNDCEASDVPPSVEEELHSNIAQLRAAVHSASSIRIRQCVTYLLAHSAPGSH
ncbi:MAG: hypothetical protein Hals2KO_00540 [Halioglobus sp.]